MTKITTVKVTQGGRIPLTDPVCKGMNVEQGDSVQIWPVGDGIFAISKVIPPMIPIEKVSQSTL